MLCTIIGIDKVSLNTEKGLYERYILSYTYTPNNKNIVEHHGIQCSRAEFKPKHFLPALKYNLDDIIKHGTFEIQYIKNQYKDNVLIMLEPKK